jgi:hypothetical protein
MLLYDNAFPNIYEEIKTCYMVQYRDVLEMDALWRVWGGALDRVQADIIQSVDNNFIDFADARTITKLEAFLGITYDEPRTLVERRNIIKAFVLGRGHVGQREIKELISVLTSGEITVELVGGVIRITIQHDPGYQPKLSDYYLVLGERIPAHLGLEINSVIPVDATAAEYSAGAMSELYEETLIGTEDEELMIYRKLFLEANWTAAGVVWQFTIPASHHLRGPLASVIEVLQAAGGVMNAVVISYTRNTGGDITLESDYPFDGLVSIV